LKKRRSWFIWDSNDTTAYIPVNFVRQLYGDNNDSLTNAIIIKPEKGVDMDAFKSELSQKLRGYRGLKAGEIDNFFINVFLDLQIDRWILGQMNVVGWIISGFSLFGWWFWNCQYHVCFRERANKFNWDSKSLGAKNRFILFQFCLKL
jgi:putative ABC transport system permease protein